METPTVNAEIEAAIAGIERDIEATRQRLHALESSPASKESFAKRLELMCEADQLARGATLVPLGKENPWTPEETEMLMERLASIGMRIDAEHYPTLLAMMERDNPFSISAVGAQAARNAWLLVQHADQHPDLQRRALEMMRELPEGDVHRIDRAYLEDRVAWHSGTPQRYGTQGSCVAGSGWQPNTLLDAARVDEFRAEVGLGPLAEYVASFAGVCP